MNKTQQKPKNCDDCILREIHECDAYFHCIQSDEKTKHTTAEELKNLLDEKDKSFDPFSNLIAKTIAVCLSAILMAGTIKFIFWMF